MPKGTVLVLSVKNMLDKFRAHLLLIFIYYFSLSHCMLVITSDEKERQLQDAHFVIQNLNLSNLDNFTMCGRFKTHKFSVLSDVDSGQYTFSSFDDLVQAIFPGFGTISAIDCDESDHTCFDVKEMLGTDYGVKHVFAYQWLTKPVKVFSSWLPKKWNTYCIKANKTEVIFQLNNDLVGQGSRNHGIIKELNFFMNNLKKRSPMNGAFTDINVWNTILQEEEESKWKNCQQRQGGNVFGWQDLSQSIQSYGLKHVNEPAENICPGQNGNNRHKFLVSKKRLDFIETHKFCTRYGSMVAVSNNVTATKVKMALESCDKWGAFTGYTDLDTEGEWLLFPTDQKLTWKNWSRWSFKRNSKKKDCSYMSKDMLFHEIRCSFDNLCQVCILAEVNNTNKSCIGKTTNI